MHSSIEYHFLLLITLPFTLKNEKRLILILTACALGVKISSQESDVLKRHWKFTWLKKCCFFHRPMRKLFPFYKYEIRCIKCENRKDQWVSNATITSLYHDIQCLHVPLRIFMLSKCRYEHTPLAARLMRNLICSVDRSCMCFLILVEDFPLWGQKRGLHSISKQHTVKRAQTPRRFSCSHDSGNVSRNDFVSPCLMPFIESMNPGKRLSHSSVSKWNPVKWGKKELKKELQTYISYLSHPGLRFDHMNIDLESLGELIAP